MRTLRSQITEAKTKQVGTGVFVEQDVAGSQTGNWL